MRAAPFYPGQKMSTTFAVSVDDTSLHFDINDLTPKQKKDDEESRDLMGFLQVAHIGIGKPADHVMMYEEFGTAPWPARVETYAEFFNKMGIDTIPPEHRHLIAKEGYYDKVAKSLPDTDSITLYLTSGTNRVLYNDVEAYRISQNVNSKFHFAENAPGYGIPVPETLVTTKGELDSADVQAFMDKYNHNVMLKTSGLAGARNVTAVGSLDEAKAYVAEYDASMPVLLQQKLDFSRWTEMTADLFVSNTDIHITNFRKIMFADGIWVGNLIGPDVEVTDAHRRELIKIGEYARSHGHCEPEGVNCGVDYFIDDDGGFIVTEINARWTGGLFPTEIIRQAGAQQETCIAFVDMVRGDKFDTYLNFIEQNLYKNSDGPFTVLPVGCSPIPQKLE
ncbi:MAG: hypothetical protein O2910_04000, partial [Proteobacteria bacterium]|nr:hypothetical protein [Pseudomonadota bacterium]